MKSMLAFAAAGGVVVLLALAFLALSDPGPAQATHIGGAGHVFVNNPSDQAVPIRDVTPPAQAVPIRDVSGRDPFTVYLTGSWGSGVYQSSKTFTVPSGKRLVVEYASIDGFTTTGHGFAELVTPSAPSNGHYFFEFTSPTSDGFTAAQPMRAYANAGTSTLILTRNATSGTGQWEATIVGYLIPTT
jgi:hypothetical protein